LSPPEKIHKQGFKRISLVLKFEQINVFYKILNEYNGKIVSERYGDLALIECLIQMNKSKDFNKALIEASSGKIKIKDKRTKMIPSMFSSFKNCLFFSDYLNTF
jgi:putative IMPACT (imprinted ancient) family translation regulator